MESGDVWGEGQGSAAWAKPALAAVDRSKLFAAVCRWALTSRGAPDPRGVLPAWAGQNARAARDASSGPVSATAATWNDPPVSKAMSLAQTEAAPGRPARRKDRRRQLGKTPGADLADRPLTAAERAERSDPARPFPPEAEIAKSPIFSNL